MSALVLLTRLFQGRKTGDDVYDLICQYLFESKSASGVGGDIFMHNLNKHYRSGRENAYDIDAELSEAYAAEVSIEREG